MNLLDDNQLDRSSVVANCRMNRERTLKGANGYARELGFNPLDLLLANAAANASMSWLDLCCGTGAALMEAAEVVELRGLGDRVQIVGIDLVAPPVDVRHASLRIVAASLASWKVERPFDIITCVHGLHYIGDKLGLIARVASWLSRDGRFAANLDLANIHLHDTPRASRVIAAELRHAGFAYDTRKKLLTRLGHGTPSFPFRYLGANDRAGPNYTGQAAVGSWYERVEK